MYWFNFFILSNQRKHWERRYRKEGRMKVNFQCSWKLIQLHFLQQTLKNFTVSDNYLCTSWRSSGFREPLSQHVRSSFWFKVELWQECSRLQFLFSEEIFVRFFSPNIVKTHQNEKSVIFISMYNICELLDLIDTCICTF